MEDPRRATKLMLPLLYAALKKTVAGGLTVTVTVGVSSTLYGYNKPVMGSTDPVNPILNGQEIIVIESVLGSYDFEVHISGNFLGQSFFDNVVVENGDGADETFTTASATFSSTSTRARWRWGTGGSSTLVWDSFDSGEEHDAVFTL